MGKTKRLLRRLLPYWLAGGDQTCECCGHRHAHHVEARCVACDRPRCSMCVIIVDGEVFCSECHAEGGT
ncbi:MAG: hypothetical protein ACXW5U_05555 [Thermoanaerobaculia bacterium]